MPATVGEQALPALVGDQVEAVDEHTTGRAGGRHDDLVADRLVVLAGIEHDPAGTPGDAFVGGAGEVGRPAVGDAVQERARVGVRLR